MAFSNEFFEIRSSTTAGQGAFALCDIPAGTLLIAEKPILRLLGNTESYIKTEANKLSPEDHEAFLALSNNHPKKGVYAGLASTNATPGDENGMIAGGNICLVVSRFNHSCSPNALYYWDKKQGKECRSLFVSSKQADIM